MPRITVGMHVRRGRWRVANELSSRDGETAGFVQRLS